MLSNRWFPISAVGRPHKQVPAESAFQSMRVRALFFVLGFCASPFGPSIQLCKALRKRKQTNEAFAAVVWLIVVRVCSFWFKGFMVFLSPFPAWQVLLMVDGCWLMLDGAWFVLHGSGSPTKGSWPMASGSWLMAQGRRLKAQDSWPGAPP